MRSADLVRMARLQLLLAARACACAATSPPPLSSFTSYTILTYRETLSLCRRVSKGSYELQGAIPPLLPLLSTLGMDRGGAARDRA